MEDMVIRYFLPDISLGKRQDFNVLKVLKYCVQYHNRLQMANKAWVKYIIIHPPHPHPNRKDTILKKKSTPPSESHAKY